MASLTVSGLEAFVVWLSEIEGVDLSSIEFQHTYEQGHYATATADLAAGSAAVELPAHMLLSYTAATAGVSARHHDPAVLRALRSLEREMRTADDTSKGYGQGHGQGQQQQQAAAATSSSSSSSTSATTTALSLIHI